MRLDDETWDALHELCRRENIPLPNLLSRIDGNRNGVPLTTATRSVAMGYFRRGVLELPGLPVPAATSNPFMEIATRFGARAVQRSSQEAGSDFEHKLQLALDHLPDVEHGRIAQHWREWLNLRSELGRTPEFTIFVERFLPGVMQDDYCNVIDVASGNPFHFCGIRIQPHSASFAGYDTSQQLIGRYPFSIHAQGMQSDFNLAKMNAMPLYHVMRQRFGGLVRSYARIVLPFSTTGATVDRLITVVRRIEPVHRAIEADAAVRGCLSRDPA